jgi:hypothetical protein
MAMAMERLLGLGTFRPLQPEVRKKPLGGLQEALVPAVGDSSSVTGSAGSADVARTFFA